MTGAGLTCGDYLIQVIVLVLKLVFGLVFGFAVLLIALGGLGHVLRLRADPPFQMLAVEGERRLHVQCEGPSEAPLVIYDAGAFGMYTDGWWVLQQLKQDHRVCLYDRAGMGWSDALPRDVSPTPDWHVEDLRRLRDALGEATPFVLIGHSMAGLRLHAYANDYPEELRGLVFVDAARPQSMDVERVRGLVPWLRRALSLSTGFARIGLAGGVSYVLPDELDLPAQQLQDKRRSISAVSHHKATRAELLAAFEAWPEASWRQETGAEQLPVFVFSNSQNGGTNAPVARAAQANTGIGGITALPDETHVSLLNQANAEKIAQAVRDITGQASDD